MTIRQRRMAAIVVVFGVVIGALVLLRVSREATLSDAALAQLPVTQELLARFVAVDPALDTHTQASSTVVWEDKEGYTILVPSTESILVAVVAGGYVAAPVSDKLFSKELGIVRNVFSRRGFSFDEQNSSTSTQDVRFYGYVQTYEKEDTLCALKVNPDYSSYPGSGIGKDAKMGYTLTVSCSNALAEADAQQRPILDALGLRGKGGMVRIVAQSGLFVETGFGYRSSPGGWTAILKQQEDTTYRVLLISQDAPPCELIEKEKIPLDVLSSIGHGGCFTNAGAYRNPFI